MTQLSFLSHFPDLQVHLRSLPTDMLLVISEETVWKIYGERFQNLLGPNHLVWIGPPGESIKTIHRYADCVEYFLNKGIHRQAHVIALGGGALSDFAGLVAATLLRGLSWSIVPTTLLAMVDAAIGGKVALNTNAGKNLLGAFHLPQNVFFLEEFLSTLPKREILSGKGEILKYAFLDRQIFEEVKRGGKEIVHLCSHYKQAIVMEDEKDLGLRMTLNLGHTFGHGLERMLPVSHGEAVVLGMEIIFRYFMDDRVLLTAFLEMKVTLGITIGMDQWQGQLDKEKLLSLVFKDKKRNTKDKLRLILLEEVGRPVMVERSFSEVESIVKGIGL